MRRMINGKRNINLKRIVSVIVIIIFLLYISITLAVSNRKYLYAEKIFKSISSNINSFFINSYYTKDNVSYNIVSSRINYLQKENDELREELKLDKQNLNYVTAEVVNHTGKTWFDTVVINKGYNKNIENDLPVVNSKGLVGFISKTGKEISEVKLLTSIFKNKMIPVLIKTNNGEIAGVLSDYNWDKEMFKISDVTNKMSVSKGDSVVLAGYDNNAYKGIYVGRVVKEEDSNYGLSRTIWVESNVNFNDILFVSVVVNK